MLSFQHIKTIVDHTLPFCMRYFSFKPIWHSITIEQSNILLRRSRFINWTSLTELWWKIAFLFLNLYIHSVSRTLVHNFTFFLPFFSFFFYSCRCCCCWINLNTIAFELINFLANIILSLSFFSYNNILLISYSHAQSFNSAPRIEFRNCFCFVRKMQTSNIILFFSFVHHHINCIYSMKWKTTY